MRNILNILMANLIYAVHKLVQGNIIKSEIKSDSYNIKILNDDNQQEWSELGDLTCRDFINDNRLNRRRGYM